MPQKTYEVTAPNGKVFEITGDRVPTEAELTDIWTRMGAQTATPEEPARETWSHQLGFDAPTSSRAVGFLRGSGGAVVDMAQGAIGAMANAVGDIGKGEMAGLEGIADPTTKPVVDPTPVIDIPDTPAGVIGSLLPIKAPTGGAVVSAAEAAIPRTARAAAKFQEVMGAARNIPVDLSEAGNVALRIAQLAEHGGSMPMAVRKFIVYATDPKRPQMVYEVSRDFASNISRLSADEMGKLTPVVAREVANLRVALNKANAMAAKAAGKLPEYTSAMREYANAMRVRNVVNAAIEGAKRSAPYATAAGAGAWLGKKFADLIDQ